MDEDTEVQWKVTWFPPDAPERHTTGEESRVRGIASQQAEWNPIIESRRVTVGPWEMEKS